MKNLILPLLMLFTVNGFAQDFEGTIHWSMKTEITDPKKKAQMEEAQRKMNDPANQAKIKEMQDKMNDPQFKSMMENNPQMKAQMEQAMAFMKGGGSMIPTGMIVKIKGLNTIMKMDGGMFTHEILNLKDKDQSYSLDKENKTYSLIPQSANEGVANATHNAKVTKTNETAKILNYSCTKYIVETTANGKPMTQELWVTTDIKGLNMKALAKSRFGKDHMYYEEIDGVPLKMKTKTADGIMTMEAISLKKESLSADDFKLPADYKEVPFMGR